MGKRALMFIPNTLALVAWGQKPMTRHLSNLINGRTEGNILNSKAAHMNKFSAYRITNASLLKNYPPPADRRKRPQDGISRVQKVAAAEKWFLGSS